LGDARLFTGIGVEVGALDPIRRSSTLYSGRERSQPDCGICKRGKSARSWYDLEVSMHCAFIEGHALVDREIFLTSS
jgi:hypothetical protein